MRKFMNSCLCATMLCEAVKTEEEYCIEGAIKEQEQKQNVGSAAAVEAAKANIEKQKLDRETREVESRLKSADRDQEMALKSLRMARKKETAEKQYLTDLNTLKSEFEKTGDWKKYDEAKEKARKDYNDAISKAADEIYGDEAWRYKDSSYRY